MTFSKKIFISCLFVSLIIVTSCGYSLKKGTNELSQKEIVVIADNSDLNLERNTEYRDINLGIKRMKMAIKSMGDPCQSSKTYPQGGSTCSIIFSDAELQEKTTKNNGRSLTRVIL